MVRENAFFFCLLQFLVNRVATVLFDSNVIFSTLFKCSTKPNNMTDVGFNIKFYRLHFVPHQRSLRNAKTPRRIHEGYVTVREFTAVIIRAGMIFLVYKLILLFLTMLAQSLIFLSRFLIPGT